MGNKFSGNKKKLLQWEIDKNGCWNVISHYINKDGHAKLRREGQQLAHRVMWIRKFGFIPEGLCILHKCDNPRCINPNHLFLGTQRDNSSDRNRKERQARGTKMNTAKLNEESVRAIRRQYVKRTNSAPSNSRELAARYNIGQEQIRNIVNGKTWKWLEGECRA